MRNRIPFQAPSDGGGTGGAGPRDNRDKTQRTSDDNSDENSDPFFKDPAVHVGEDVARSLQGEKPARDSKTGEHEVIRDAYTTEVPYESETTDYDGASYGGQMSQLMKDKQRESDSRPKGIDAAELEAIYGKRWRSDDTLTIKEGRPKREFSVWRIPGIGLLIKLAILGAIVFGLFAIRLPIVDEDGMDTTSALPIWIYQQSTMGNEHRMMQRLEPHERRFALTLMRMRRVSRAAMEYELAFGTPPSDVNDLIAENLLRHSRATDGWGNFFRIEVHMEVIHVRSAGRDSAFSTDDDITVVGNSYPTYSSIHYSRETSGGTVDLMDI